MEETYKRILKQKTKHRLLGQGGVESKVEQDPSPRELGRHKEEGQGGITAGKKKKLEKKREGGSEKSRAPERKRNIRQKFDW